MYQSVSKWAVSTLYSLLSLWHNNKLVYPPELSRIAGFCTNSNKIFLGEDPQTPLSSRIANHLKKLNTYPNLPPPTIFLTNSRSKFMVSICLIWKVHCLSFFREWMFKRTKKSPWKVLENVPQKSLKSPWKRYVMICGNHDGYQCFTNNYRLCCYGKIQEFHWLISDAQNKVIIRHSCLHFAMRLMSI